MSRQEATNTFNDGMIKDMNPLTTPNTVLTDCINGTLITYNGNEFVLQNDMGNYKLPLASLGSDFIPVGIREYGNIIYIISYNPIKDLCQIGSYPSPQRIFISENDSDGKETNIEILPTFEYNYKLYTEFEKSLKTWIYSNDDNYKLYSGDLFHLYNENIAQLIGNNNWYELSHYVFTEESKLIPITISLSDITTGKISTTDTKLWNVVNWTTPGWICCKSRVLNISKLSFYITNLKYNQFEGKTLTCTLILEVWTDDYLYTTDLLKNINFRIRYDGDEVTYKTTGQVISYGSENITYKDNTQEDPEKTYGTLLSEDVTHSTLEYPEIQTKVKTVKLDLTVTKNAQTKQNAEIIKTSLYVTPVVTNIPYKDVNEEIELKEIIYDQFTTKIDISSEDIFNKDTISLLSIYKYLINDNGITLNYFISGPFNSNSNIIAKYDIKKLSDDGELVSVFEEKQEKQEKQEIIDINLYGQNTLSIEWNSKFVENDIYTFTIYLYNKDTSEEIISESKLLITSRLLNTFYSTRDDFNEIYLNEWISNLATYGSGYNVSKTEITNLQLDPITQLDSTKFPNTLAPEYSTYISSSYIKNFTASITLSCDYTATLDNFEKFLPNYNRGRLFKNIEVSRTLSYKYNESSGAITDLVVNNKTTNYPDPSRTFNIDENLTYKTIFSRTQIQTCTFEAINQSEPIIQKIEVPLIHYMSGNYVFENSSDQKLASSDLGIKLYGTGDTIGCSLNRIKKYNSDKTWINPPGWNVSSGETKESVENIAETWTKASENWDMLINSDTIGKKYCIFVVYIEAVYPMKFNMRYNPIYNNIPYTGGYAILVRTKQGNQNTFVFIPCEIADKQYDWNFNINGTVEEQLTEINKVVQLLGKYLILIKEGGTTTYANVNVKSDLVEPGDWQFVWKSLNVSHKYNKILYKFGDSSYDLINDTSNLSDLLSKFGVESNNLRKLNESIINIKSLYTVKVPDTITLDWNIDSKIQTKYNEWISDNENTISEYIKNHENDYSDILKNASSENWNTIKWIGDDYVNVNNSSINRLVSMLKWDKNNDVIYCDYNGELAETWFYNNGTRNCWRVYSNTSTCPIIPKLIKK